MVLASCPVEADMVFSWFKRRRRSQILAAPFPADWLTYLNHNVRQYRLLTPHEQAKLRQRVQVFVHEKKWVGCGALPINDEIKVTIAAQACLLVLGIDYEYHYDQIRSLLVYPNTYLHPPEIRAGVFRNGAPVYGEAWHRGPIVLSWKNTLGLPDEEGGNLVFHEFAHHLDDLDGGMDGRPPLECGQERRWDRVIDEEYHRLLRASLQGRATLLNEYGASNRAEFFAVATECFFERPVALRDHHVQLYTILRDFYRQDPAGWPWELVNSDGAGLVRPEEPNGCVRLRRKPGKWNGKGTADAFFSEGVWLMNEHRHEEAVAAFGKAIELAPNDAEALAHRALALVKAGEPLRAMEDASVAIRLDDTDSMAWCVRATAYLANSQYDKALADCQRTIRLDSKNGEAYRLRGLAFAGLGRLREALGDYHKAIHFNANLADTLRARAEIHERLGRLNKAQADLDKAERFDRTSTEN